MFLLLLGISTVVETINGFYIGLTRNIGLFCIGIIALAFVFLSTKRRCLFLFFRRSNSKLFTVFYFFIILCVFYILISTFVRGRNIVDVLKTSYYYFLFFFVPVFAFIFKVGIIQDRNFYVKNTMLISCCFDIIAIFFWLLVFAFGNEKLGFNVYTRSSIPRLMIDSGLLMISPVVSLYSLSINRYRRLAIFNLFTFFFNLVFINQTRGYYLVYLMIIFSIFVVKQFRKKDAYKTSRFIFATFVVALFLVGFLCCINAFGGLGLFSDKTVSFRIGTIGEYFSRFLKNPFFGFGFLPDKMDEIGFMASYGFEGSMSHDDVGLLGILDTFGIVGIVPIICILYFPFKVFRRTNNRKLLIPCLFIGFGLLYGCISLIAFNPTRFSFLVLIISLLCAISSIEKTSIPHFTLKESQVYA